MLASQIINQALKAAGSLALGQNPSNEQSADGLIALKNLIALWSIQKLFVPYTAQTLLTLTANDGAYTFGTGGDFTTRPLRMDAAFIRYSSQDYPIEIISKGDYNRIPDKATTGMPEKMVYEIGYPLANMLLYPVPDLAYALYVEEWKTLTQPSLLADTMTFPDEYNDPLIANLALILCNGTGIQIDPALQARADKGVKILKNYNAPPVNTVQYDRAILYGLRK